jgi:cytochrome oxidase Cu insertion factor (SCO1/SenC/PrrC family)
MQIIDKEDISLKLLSLSIDPERDGPVELAAWLQMFNAGKIWRAGAPTPQFSREFGLFFEVAKSVIDAHDARIFIITPVGTLSYITEDFPSPDAVVALIKEGMKMSETKSLP